VPIDLEGGHQARILEKGGSWGSAILIALKSMRKSSSERKKRRKSWPAGKGKKIKLQTTLTSKSIPIERQDRVNT